MPFDSILFPAFLLFALVGFNASRGSAYQPYVRLGINIAFISSFVNGLAELAPLTVFLLLGFVSVRLSKRYANFWVTLILILATLVAFCVLKKYPFTHVWPQLHFPYLVLGLSYILFRILQLVIDCHQGAIKQQIPIIEYLNFTTNFLCFVSGPVQRFQDNHRDVAQSSVERKDDDVVYAFSRILTGYIKLLLLSAFFSSLHDTYGLEYFNSTFGLSLNVAIGWYAFSAVTYCLHLYFNFSGYIDIVIGAGRIFGFTLPENFDRPFQSRSFIEFWGRWHMTVSNWFKFYVFNPLVKALTQRAGAPWMTPYIGVLAYFVTFFIVGYWHIPSIWLGVFFGAGISINKLYQIWMRKWLGKERQKQLTKNQFYSRLCQGMTFSYFCISITFLWIDMNSMLQLFSTSLIKSMLLAFLGISIGAGLFFGALAIALTPVSNLARGSNEFFQRFPFKYELQVGMKAFFVLYLALAAINPAPEFIYQGF